MRLFGLSIWATVVIAKNDKQKIEQILSDGECSIISDALDDCRIAACRTDKKKLLETNEINLGEIPEGAICRLKCRGLKAQRCRCCAAGFAIGRECPAETDPDNCKLQIDENAFYEGADAELVHA